MSLDANTIVQSRLSDMRNARSNYQKIWRISNRRRYSFLNEGRAFYPPTMWTITNDLSQEIISAFDGNIKVEPTSVGKPDLMYTLLSNVYNKENNKVNVQLEREVAIQNAVCYRIGVLFEGYLDNQKEGSFEGLITESVDPRDFFIDDSAQIWYDPLGYRGAKDCIRRRWYSASNVREVFSDSKYNQKAVDMAIGNVKEMGAKGTPYANNNQGQYLNRDIQSTMNDVMPIDRYGNHFIQVLEYWSNDRLIIEFDNASGIPVYDGENPYGMLPFTVYSLFNTGESIYTPSMIDIAQPIVSRKDVMTNLMYLSAKLNQTPLIYADSKTGLVSGQEIIGGVQTVKLEDKEDIRQSIQQIQLGGISSSSQYMSDYLENELISATKIDPKSLRTTPQETATKTKRKIETELKNVRNIVTTMMKGAEQYRAILRCKNILKYVFADTKDVLVNDVKQLPDGELVSSRGTQTPITINPDDWENFEFNVEIKSTNENEIEKEEKINQSLRLLEIINAYRQDPLLSPEEKKKANIVALMEEIVENIPLIDTTKVFAQDNNITKLKEDIDTMKLGGSPTPIWKDEKQRIRMLRTIANAMAEEQKKPKKDIDMEYNIRLLEYFNKINEKQNGLEEPTQQAQAPAEGANAGVQPVQQAPQPPVEQGTPPVAQ